MAQSDGDVLFLYIGFPLDAQLTDLLKQLESVNSNFKYIGGLDKDVTLHLIRQSWAYLNTSVNEGMCLALLEAMKLRVPVLARHNMGNSSIIKNKLNGLLFSDQMDLIKSIRFLKQIPACDRDALINNAYEYMEKNHSTCLEKVSYVNTIKRALEVS
jgi:glycosyltransferase involved in cell wall biosynthesis